LPKERKALIFVVDCSDKQNIAKSREAIQLLMKDKEFCELPLLVYAHKRDVEGAMTTLQVVTNLGLHNLVNEKGWHVQASSILEEDFGLYEGLDWLVSTFENQEVEKLQAKMSGL